MRILAAAFVLIAATAQAKAVTLQPIPQAPTQRLPIQTDAPNYSCAEVADKLEAYNTMARSHDQSVSSFLGQVTEKAMQWYSDLQPLEGKSQQIKEGTFEPIQTGATEIGNITNLAFDNSELLANELDRIIVSLRQCQFK